MYGGVFSIPCLNMVNGGKLNELYQDYRNYT